MIEFIDSLDIVPAQWTALSLAGVALAAFLIDAFRECCLQVAKAFGTIAQELADDDQEGVR